MFFWENVEKELHRQGVKNIEEMVVTWKMWIEQAIRKGYCHIKKQELDELKSEELLLLQNVLTLQYGLTIRYNYNEYAKYSKDAEVEWYTIGRISE